MGLCEWLLAEGASIVCSLVVVTAYSDAEGILPLGVTASGARTRPGVAACGPSWEFGTVIALPAIGRVMTCLDRGGGVGDRDVDLWQPTRRAALRFGRRGVRAIIFIVEPEGEKLGPMPGSALPLRSAPVWRGTSRPRGAWHPAEVHPGT